MYRPLVIFVLVGLLAGSKGSLLLACPFCQKADLTLSDRIDMAAVALVGRVVERTNPAAGATLSSAAGAQLKLEIVELMKGGDSLKSTANVTVFYNGRAKKGDVFLLTGIEQPLLIWNAPIPFSVEAGRYLAGARGLPPKGGERMRYFLPFLEHNDAIIAEDAFGEFTRCPYEELLLLKDDYPHDDLLAWVQDDLTSTNRKRVYLTLLSICARPGDIAIVRRLMEEASGLADSALDATISCYLTMTGEKGLEFIEDEYLRPQDADFHDTYAAIQAMRFQIDQKRAMDRERMLQAMRLLLDRPEVADLVIEDFIRWEDWSIRPQLVALFNQVEGEEAWARVPILRFLMECPEPAAKRDLKTLAKFDPDAMEKAKYYKPLVDGLNGEETTAVAGGPSSADKNTPGMKNDPASASANALAANATAPATQDGGSRKSGGELASSQVGDENAGNHWSMLWGLPFLAVVLLAVILWRGLSPKDSSQEEPAR